MAVSWQVALSPAFAHKHGICDVAPTGVAQISEVVAAQINATRVIGPRREEFPVTYRDRIICATVHDLLYAIPLNSET